MLRCVGVKFETRTYIGQTSAMKVDLIRKLIFLNFSFLKNYPNFYFQDSLSGNYPNYPQCGHLRLILPYVPFGNRYGLEFTLLAHGTPYVGSGTWEFLDRPGSQAFTAPSIWNRQTNNLLNSYGVISNKLLAAYV